MGEVYKARDTRLNRLVAIKLLPRDSAGDSERRNRLPREARTSSSLNHPNIVTVHDVLSANGQDAIVMESSAGVDQNRRYPPTCKKRGFDTVPLMTANPL